MKKRQPDAALTLTRPADIDVAGLLRRASPALLVVGAWLAFHPYAGIVHDSRLYVAQALRVLQPGVFDRDLFFAFGSQDDFTLFSRLFAPLVARFGPSVAAMLVVAVGQALWLSGAAALAARLAPTRPAAVAGLVLAAVLPAYYGGWQLFSYGEGFATPRLLAEGIGLWALWALTGRRLLLAAALVFAAALMHPIIAATVAGAGFCTVVLEDWRWGLLGLSGAAVAAVLAHAGVAPFDGLLRTMDAEWLAVVRQRNMALFPDLWRSMDWGRVGTAAAMTAAGAVILTGWRRRLLLAVAVCCLAGLAATHLGADILDIVFWIQVQAWRTLWLLQLFAYLAVGILVLRLWQLPEDGVGLVALTAFAWLAGFMLPPGPGVAILVFALALAVARLRGACEPLPAIAQTAAVVLAGLALGVLVAYRVVSVKGLMAVLPDATAVWDSAGHITMIEAAVAAAMAVALYRLRPGLARTALPVAALLLAVASVAAWDRSDGWTRTVTADRPVAAFASLLPADAQVYWEGDVRGAWLLLRRPSYISRAQGGGLVFRRRTALAFRDRARIINPLAGRDLLDSYRARESAAPLPALTRPMLVSACRADGALDAMVLSRTVPGAAVAQWDLPAPIYDMAAAKRGIVRPPVRRLYLYRCQDLR